MSSAGNVWDICQQHGSESPSVEVDVDVRHYTILELHVRNDDDDDDDKYSHKYFANRKCIGQNCFEY